MKRCPNCMKITESKFCPDCGYDLSTVESAVCPNCETESNSKFCPSCGTSMNGSSQSTITKEKAGAANDDNGTTQINNDNESVVFDADKIRGSNVTGNKLLDLMKRKPAIAGVIIAVVVIVLIASLGSNSNKGSSSHDISTDSHSVVDESEQNTVSDNDYSSNSSTYSYTDDGLDLIQGSWKLAGVVNDGELTDVGGLSVGSLVINGDQWEMTISTTETTESSGTLYLDMAGNLDSGGKYYVYTMKSGGYSGSVKMAYSSDDNFIAVSTSSKLDPNNCMMFGR